MSGQSPVLFSLEMASPRRSSHCALCPSQKGRRLASSRELKIGVREPVSAFVEMVGFLSLNIGATFCLRFCERGPGDRGGGVAGEAGGHRRPVGSRRTRASRKPPLSPRSSPCPRSSPSRFPSGQAHPRVAVSLTLSLLPHRCGRRPSRWARSWPSSTRTRCSTTSSSANCWWVPPPRPSRIFWNFPPPGRAEVLPRRGVAPALVLRFDLGTVLPYLLVASSPEAFAVLFPAELSSWTPKASADGFGVENCWPCARSGLDGPGVAQRLHSLQL